MKILLVILIVFTITVLGGSPKNNRIVGGTVTTTGKYPYHVQIVQLISGSYTQFCGGSILSSGYVLSAANCFRSIQGTSNVDRSLTDVYVVSTSKISGITNNKRYTISQVFIHPSYSATVNVTNQVDLCILKVSTITFDSSTLPVVLARQQDKSLFPAGTDSFVTGFGATNGTLGTQPNPSNDLLGVTIPIVSQATCNQALNNSGIIMNYSILCAGANGKDSCFGDGGGALTIASQNTYVQVGVVSSGTASATNPLQCGGQGNYGVYISVADYRTNFIEPITGALPVLGDSGVAFTNGTNSGTTGGTTGGKNSSNTLSLSPLLISLFFLFIIINFF